MSWLEGEGQAPLPPYSIHTESSPTGSSGVGSGGCLRRRRSLDCRVARVLAGHGVGPGQWGNLPGTASTRERPGTGGTPGMAAPGSGHDQVLTWLEKLGESAGAVRRNTGAHEGVLCFTMFAIAFGTVIGAMFLGPVVSSTTDWLAKDHRIGCRSCRSARQWSSPSWLPLSMRFRDWTPLAAG